MDICGRDRFVVLVKLDSGDFGVFVYLGSKRSGVFKQKTVEFRSNNVPRCIVVPQSDKICICISRFGEVLI